MRNGNDDSGTVLPWLLIREDGHGNRYRVGSYASRAEAQRIADRLGEGGRAGRDGRSDTDSYLVEWLDLGSGTRS